MFTKLTFIYCNTSTGNTSFFASYVSRILGTEIYVFQKKKIKIIYEYGFRVQSNTTRGYIILFYFIPVVLYIITVLELSQTQPLGILFYFISSSLCCTSLRFSSSVKHNPWVYYFILFHPRCVVHHYGFGVESNTTIGYIILFYLK